VLFVVFGILGKRVNVPMNSGIILFAATLLFYGVGLLESGVIYQVTQRDAQNVAGVLVIVPLLFSLDRNDFAVFLRNVQSMSAVVSAIIALVGLYKFELITVGVSIDVFWIEGYPYPWGASLVVDYNFFAFAMLVGALSSLFCLTRSATIVGKVFYLSTFLLSALAMALSGSRRGWVTEAVFLALVCVGAMWASISGLLGLRGTSIFSRGSRNTAASLLIVVSVVTLFTYRYGGIVMQPGLGAADQIGILSGRFDTLTDPTAAFAERSERWTYSMDLLEQSSLKQLLLGQGFEYLPHFASVFQTRTAEDYPHNPIISAALYSGLVGAFIVIVLLVFAGYEFYRKRSIDKYFALIYFACLWFVLASFNSLFSGKCFMFMLLMPWVLKAKRPRLA